MSKELPYFKFYVNEWITGDITLEDYAVQGLFTNICAYYWSKECKCTLTMINKKFKGMDDEIKLLISTKIMKVDSHDNLHINFLLEQKNEWKLLSKTNAENGKKGGRPKTETKANLNPNESEIKPTALFSLNRNESETKAKKSNIEEKIVEEIRKEEKIVDVVGTSTTNLMDISLCRIAYEKEFSQSIETLKKKLKLNDEIFTKIINIFDEHLIASGKLKKDLDDYAKHFNFWLNKFDYKSIINEHHKPKQSSLDKYK